MSETELATSFPNKLYNKDFESPLPGVWIIFLPLLLKVIATSGFTNAILLTASSMYPASV